MGKIKNFFREIGLIGTMRKLGLNPINLTFRYNVLEKNFYDFYYEKKINQIRAAFVLGTLFYVLFHILDTIMFPEYKQSFWIIRFYVVAPFALLVLLSSFTKYFIRFFQFLIALAILMAGWGIIAMIYLVKSQVMDNYYVGIILVLFTAYTFIGLRFVWAAVTCWIIALSYIFIAAFYINLDKKVLINNITFLLSANLLGMAASYIMEYFIRRDYFFNRLLEDANSKVIKAKEQLESIVAVRTEELRKSYEKLKKETEEKRELTEKQEDLQKQLIQSQKMEAIGLLAGGVAHDFNNLLTVINGYSELLLLKYKNNKDEDTIRQIYSAGKKAETLTRQLLAFSRKQIMKQVVVDMNVLIKNIETMLKHMVGENTDIIFLYENDIHKIMADPGQLEQVIVNLIINARDAMPEGGVIKVITENVSGKDLIFEDQQEKLPDEMVCLSVSDTGTGMEKDVLMHIFEPFFTTKGKNKGTGLGLSTVYGIVKQTGGYIKVDSEPGKGTTFKIYFEPYFTDEKASYNLEIIKKDTVKDSGDGRIALVVEDDESVKDFIEYILKDNGYRVISAANGDTGYKTFMEHKNEIELLITDVIMPGMSGKELIDKILKTDPQIKYIFISGYTDDILGKHGIVSSEINLIQKPFSREDFLSKIRTVISAN